jgi:hypothetical protein
MRYRNPPIVEIVSYELRNCTAHGKLEEAQKKFSVHDMGPVAWLLGMTVERDLLLYLFLLQQ